MGRIVGQNETGAQPSTHPPASRDSAARLRDELATELEWHLADSLKWPVESKEWADLSDRLLSAEPVKAALAALSGPADPTEDTDGE